MEGADGGRICGFALAITVVIYALPLTTELVFFASPLTVSHCWVTLSAGAGVNAGAGIGNPGRALWEVRSLRVPAPDTV